MRLAVLLVALVAFASASEDPGEKAHRQLMACKTAECRKKYFAVYEADTKLRLRTLLLEEELRSQQEAGRKARKCMKEHKKGKKQDLCLWYVREKQLRRKASLLRRSINQQGLDAYRACKDLKKEHGASVVHQCKRRVKLETAKRDRVAEQLATEIVQSTAVDDIRTSAEFSPLIAKASKCATLKCQTGIVTEHCTMTGGPRRECIRTVLGAPLATDANPYAVRLAEESEECGSDSKCIYEHFELFREQTETQVRSLARLQIADGVKKARAAIQVCGADKKCARKAYISAKKDAYEREKMISTMNFHVQLRQCKTLDRSLYQACKSKAKSEKKWELKLSMKRLEKQLQKMLKSHGHDVPAETVEDDHDDEKDSKNLIVIAKVSNVQGPAKMEEEDGDMDKNFELPQTPEERAVEQHLVALEMEQHEDHMATLKDLDKNDQKKDADTVAHFVAKLHELDDDGLEAWAHKKFGTVEHPHSHLYAVDQPRSHRVDPFCAFDTLQRFAEKMEAASKGLARLAARCRSAECTEHYEIAIDELADEMRKRKRLCQ